MYGIESLFLNKLGESNLKYVRSNVHYISRKLNTDSIGFHTSPVAFHELYPSESYMQFYLFVKCTFNLHSKVSMFFNLSEVSKSEVNCDENSQTMWVNIKKTNFYFVYMANLKTSHRPFQWISKGSSVT